MTFLTLFFGECQVLAVLDLAKEKVFLLFLISPTILSANISPKTPCYFSDNPENSRRSTLHLPMAVFNQPNISVEEFLSCSNRHKKKWNQAELTHLEWFIWYVDKTGDSFSKKVLADFTKWYSRKSYGDYLQQLRRQPTAICCKAAEIAEQRQQAGAAVMEG